MQANKFEVTPDESGTRLDLYVVSKTHDISRAEAQRWIEGKDSPTPGVLVNGLKCKSNTKLSARDVVEICETSKDPYHIVAENLPIEIIFEDEYLMVVNKARGMVVHPAPGARHGTLVHAALAHTEELAAEGGENRPGIVHRLDKDTGGLLVIAKTDLAHRSLQEQIQSRSAIRRYKAILWGVPTFKRALVEAPIGRHPADKTKMAVIIQSGAKSREARTELTVLETYDCFSLVEAKLDTGRTHQIRVHCAYIKHPVFGDLSYGGIKQVPTTFRNAGVRKEVELAMHALGGQALHAFYLSFDHPVSGERMEFEVPLPVVMESVLEVLWRE